MKQKTVSLEDETDHHIEVGEVREKTDESKLSPQAGNRLVLADQLVGGQADGGVGQW
jgi:hypothetical protein